MFCSHRMLVVVVFLFISTARAAAPAATQSASTRPAFEDEILAFEASDRVAPPFRHAVLFVGSSSIRMWKTLPEDLPGVILVNRGFGGSTIQDNIRYAGRIITRYEPRQIFLYAGDNDIAKGMSAEQVLADFQTFVKKVRVDLPGVPIAFIAIKPSPSRIRFIAETRRANVLVRAYTLTDPSLTFVDIFTPMLHPDGLPRESLFLSDRLHLSREGYKLWADIIRPHIR